MGSHPDSETISVENLEGQASHRSAADRGSLPLSAPSASLGRTSATASSETILIAAEVMELLQFHGLSRLAFTLNEDDIKFQKMVALLKQILKTHQNNERQMKLNQESHTRAAASDGNLEPETVSLAQQTR